MSQPPPRRSWRRRSHTARALEIVRLTRRPKANWAGWSSAVRSARSNTLPANATPPSGEPTSPPSMAPGARSAAMGAEIPAAGVPEPTEVTDAPVTSPGDCGGDPFLSYPPRRWW